MEQQSNGLAKASLPLGIISVVLSGTGVTFIFALLAVIFGGIGSRKTYCHGVAVAGIITGIFGLIFSSIVGIVYLMLLFGLLSAPTY